MQYWGIGDPILTRISSMCSVSCKARHRASPRLHLPKIDNVEIDNAYFVMIIETQVDAVDEERSEFQKYEVNDPVRPDRAGEYRSFFNLVVDPSKIGDHHIFRLKKHLGSIIVSEEVKRRFEAVGVTGAVFESVNGDMRTVA